MALRFFVKFLSAVKTSYLPALILLFVSFFCAAYSNFTSFQNNLFQISFYVVLFLSLGLILFSRNFKNIFFLLILRIISLVFNHLRFLQIPQPLFQDVYGWFMLIVPLTFVFLNVLPKNPAHFFWIFVFLLVEGLVVENFYLLQISIFSFKFNCLCPVVFYLYLSSYFRQRQTGQHYRGALFCFHLSFPRPWKCCKHLKFYFIPSFLCSYFVHIPPLCCLLWILQRWVNGRLFQRFFSSSWPKEVSAEIYLSFFLYW